MISRKHKFIFIHIPKTAGTSLEKVLTDDSCLCRRNKWGRFNAPLNHLTLQQLRKGDFISADEFRSFYKFAFVRNPWDRVISECFCPHIQLIFKGCTGIEDKIKKVCSLSEKGYANHCKNQVAFIAASDIKMDFVGRFENLQEDFNYLCKDIGVSSFKLPHVNKSFRKDYQKYYTPPTRELVEKSYHKDILRFGYQFKD